MSKSSRRARASVEAKIRTWERAVVLRGDVATTRAEVDAELAAQRARQKIDADDAAMFARRIDDATAALGGTGVAAYAKEHGVGGVQVVRTNKGARIVRLVCEAFPGHVNYAYLIDVEDQRILFDVGTGLFTSRRDLLECLRIAGTLEGETIEPSSIDVVFISHGHIDHFGDAAWWKNETGAAVWVHELDARVLENFRERAILTSRDMRLWLSGVGLPAARVDELAAMYLSGKDQYASVAVDRRLRHGELLFHDRARVIHTPGHCPGHVCLRIDDALLVADQVLAPITPHITPQALNPHNGLERYLFGLARVLREDGVAHVLPAHYEPIPDLQRRVVECIDDHVEKLRITVDACRKEATIAEVSSALFGQQEGYAVLLALLEAGTHVEYLHQLGALVVDDLDAVAAGADVSLRYRATDTAAATTEGARTAHAAIGGG